MKRQIATTLCSAVLSSAVLAMTSFPPAVAQQKSARAAQGAPTLAGVGPNSASREGYTSVKDLMESIVDPSADVLWGAAGTVVDNEGIHELLPKTPDEWRDVRRAAVRIIEGSNLLMMPGRDAAPAGTKSETPGVELEPAEISALIKKKRKDFDGFAKALQGLGWEALRASETKNTDLLVEIGGRMENVCEGCHQTFWYPLEKLPPAHR